MAEFKQFCGLVQGNADTNQIWQIVWFATIWQIWLSTNKNTFEQQEFCKSGNRLKLQLGFGLKQK
jgi:hypothetical protein